ncbi:TIM protein [Trichosporon asahii var. asahii CBS 2479]|uniref:Triosephosphate isomerase n=1 Tax=Trichosporon asahii var. asahii (strain ATCC 90039 / CBS 2479 / JCM 2466 / KCTC 7840 / NBRC 103889/ NCYC 2677 / UAMH 7654) TaxID=1186058 RepID=J6F4S1_TRIAS|nr:TIM protein [Trichosporon asahii var. asahii CBS 2479]EJT51999.1 TIM protein [Trichosporon asahii var. asahii CBS 2479]
MNGSQSLVKQIVDQLNNANLDGTNEVVIAPPAIYLLDVSRNIKPPVEVAAQNSYTVNSGAYTGEISPEQIKDAGIPWVILGHSERRSLFGDSDKIVADKVKAALAVGLKVIACIGETLEEREKGVTNQPVWAIGTGKVATAQQAQDVHHDLRKWLGQRVSQPVADATRIIYGGSVNAKNCTELATGADIDGFLVGGASLKPEFIDICKCKKN